MILRSMAFLGLMSCAFAASAQGEAVNPFSSDGAEIKGPPRVAEFLVLDKITGRKKRIAINSGEVAAFGTLLVKLYHCVASPPEEVLQEAKAFIEVFENPPGGKKFSRVFHGWMFASSPAIHAIEHSVYDIWPISCKDREPGT